MTNLSATSEPQFSTIDRSPEWAMDSSVLLWFRDDLTRQSAQAYWRGGHAQLVARNPALSEYRQHHFHHEGTGLWPFIASVETTIPEDRRVDGMPEVRLKGVTALILNSGYGKKVLVDEVNVFKRTILYATPPKGGAWFKSGYGEAVEFRCVVLIKRKSNVARTQFKRFVYEELCPLLNSSLDILELRAQVFMPWKQKQWDSPGVAHDNLEEDQYHASLVLGARTKAEMLQAFERLTAPEFCSKQAWFCTAIHAYEVENTYTYCVNGRPTLPQLKPEPHASIEPMKRDVAPAPERAKQKSSERPIRSAVKLPLSGATPEDVIVDNQGRLICGVEDGRILRIDPSTRVEESLCSTGGRPLGLELGPDGRLIICDAHKGLLAYDFATHALTTLVQFVDTVPLRFCSNATMQHDGTIWFTESTSRFDFEQSDGAFIEHRPSGRLLRRDPSGRVTVVLSDLFFPNGLSLNEEETAVLFAETAAYRISRLWISGSRKGEKEILADNLPGMPDNMSRIQNGRFWVALVTPRLPALDSLARSSAFLRKLIWAIPKKWQPKPVHTMWVMCFDQDGHLLEDVQRSDLAFSNVTGVVQTNGKLYMATVTPEERSLLEVQL